MAKLDKLTTQVKDHFNTEEEILGAVQGAYETKILGQESVRNGALFATNERLVFYAKKVTGYDLESFPYSNISSIEMSKGIMGHSITFFASGNRVKVKWIKTDKNLGEFVELIRKKMGSSPASVNNPDKNQAGIAGRLKQLADLKAQGVISDEEFQEKKASMLKDL